jgi:uncharacterized membrane protein YgcG
MLRFCFLFMLTLPFSASRAWEIPEFTPNVVDPKGYLSETEKAEVNQAIDRLRLKSDILAAVFLIDRLGDETIEELSGRSFRKWELGEKEKNNGLLLVLAMEDRKSRIHIGTGLERSLTDDITRDALEGFLRPAMRAGNKAQALIETLEFLGEMRSEKRSHTQTRKGRLRDILTEEGGVGGISNIIDEQSVPRGVLGYLIFFFGLWGLPLLSKLKDLSRIRNLEVRIPGFQRELIKYYPHGIRNEGGNAAVSSFRFGSPFNMKGAPFVKLFLTINPGCFIFMGAMINFWAFVGLSSLTVFIFAVIFFKREGSVWYADPKHVEDYLVRLRGTYQDKIKKGYVIPVADGIYEYTEAYYASDLYQSEQNTIATRFVSSPSERWGSSRSSGSSSSSSRSSSGGGSSSGRGSSSSW